MNTEEDNMAGGLDWNHLPPDEDLSIDEIREEMGVAREKLIASLARAGKQAHVWREEAWQCYVESGADSDGADARHLNPGEAVGAVREARELAEEADRESETAERELARAIQALTNIRDHTPDKAPSFDPYSVVRRVARLALEDIGVGPGVGGCICCDAAIAPDKDYCSQCVRCRCQSSNLAERLEARGVACRANGYATHDGPRDTEFARAQAFYDAAQMAREPETEEN